MTEAEFTSDKFKLIHGDCLEVLAEMEADSVDTVITDPPYGLEFMGKEWDKGIPGIPFWKAALRVAKPGAMLLCFGGTRTWHRIACAIEGAGWEIRDTICYLYGSGFPKSLDIGKAIDKAAGAEREVVGRDLSRYRPNNEQAHRQGQIGDFGLKADGSGLVTRPATEAAQQWDGWGTGLKPAFEPIIVAMKPLDGTFANNALKHGVAGLWIDGGRIQHGEDVDLDVVHRQHSDNPLQIGGAKPGDVIAMYKPSGRWPANAILDEAAAAQLDQQSGPCGSTSGQVQPRPTSDNGGASWSKGEHIAFHYADAGGASRFFRVCQQDMLCVLCGLPFAPDYGIMGIKECDESCSANGVVESSNHPNGQGDSVATHVPPVRLPEDEASSEEWCKRVGDVVKSLRSSPETNGFSALTRAQLRYVAKTVLRAKSAASLCNSCAIGFAVSLVVTVGQHEALESPPLRDLGAFLPYMALWRSSILSHNLAAFAELLGNTDITPTTSSLSLLFGSVQNAIAGYINLADEERGANIESAPMRFRYVSKASRAEREAGLEELLGKSPIFGADTGDGLGRGVSNTRQDLRPKNNHPTVKPVALMRYLCRLTKTPTGGVVLDPFMGSGSTGVACVEEGRSFIGIEIDESYYKIAEARITHAQRQKQHRLVI